MVTRRHAITLALALVALVAAAAGCQNKHEIRTAKQSVYDADFAIVYSEVLAATSELYPNLDDNPTEGVVSTAWHQVRFSTGADDPRSVQQRDRALGVDQTGATGNPFAGRTSTANKRLFIRFDVYITGGRPWRVRVVGKASEWEPGNAVPSELRGAATPHWLPGRIDGLTVAIYRRLKKYAKLSEQPLPEIVEEAPPDLAPYGPIPVPAAEVAAAIVKAVETRDVETLRALVDDEVVWSLGAPGSADAALAMWQAAPETLAALATQLRGGCRAESDVKVSCPPAATETPGYVGWRATLEVRGAAWKLTSFVEGD
jgi:hypothetical protein